MDEGESIPASLPHVTPLRAAQTTPMCPCAVLGRFVHTLNQFCKEHHAMEYDVKDYWIYEFAKVCCMVG